MNNLHKLLYVTLAVLLVVLSAPGLAYAQSVQGQLGDSTVYPGLPSNAGTYGMNSSAESVGTTNFATRHHRDGQDGGIGSSFLGTTSATAESKPLARYTSAMPITSPAVSWPDELNRSFSEMMHYSPAISPMIYRQPVSADLSEQSYRPVDSGNIDLQPYNLFWGHQKSGGSFPALMSTPGGSQPLSK